MRIPVTAVLLTLALASCNRSGRGQDSVAPVVPAAVSGSTAVSSYEAPVSPKPSGGSIALSAGTKIHIITSDVIDSDTSGRGFFVHAFTLGDVLGTDGKVAIPDHSSAVIKVLDSGRADNLSRLVVALYQISIDSSSFVLIHGTQHLAQEVLTEDAAKGAAHRSVHLLSSSQLDFTLSEHFPLKR